MSHGFFLGLAAVRTNLWFMHCVRNSYPYSSPQSAPPCEDKGIIREDQPTRHKTHAAFVELVHKRIHLQSSMPLHLTFKLLSNVFNGILRPQVPKEMCGRCTFASMILLLLMGTPNDPYASAEPTPASTPIAKLIMLPNLAAVQAAAAAEVPSQYTLVRQGSYDAHFL